MDETLCNKDWEDYEPPAELAAGIFGIAEDEMAAVLEVLDEAGCTGRFDTECIELFEQLMAGV